MFNVAPSGVVSTTPASNPRAEAASRMTSSQPFSVKSLTFVFDILLPPCGQDLPPWNVMSGLATRQSLPKDPQ